jgi:undecaprenyl phosphate-alpha-L-ara4FN deformylase
MKSFTLRIDIESDKGIREGLPKLLDLLKKYKIKASFYIVMAGESNVLDIIRYRKKLGSAAERKIKIFSTFEKIRMLLLPRDFVITNEAILKRILEEGHELGLHGWKHRAWTRGFEKINKEINIELARERYIKIFGKKPISFSAPGFNTDKEVISILESKGIKFISDFQGSKPKKCSLLTNIPITIKGKDNMPIIEYLAGEGYSDKEIVTYLKDQINNKELSSLYIHDLYEARVKLQVLEEVFKFIKMERIKVKRIIDY